MSAPELSVQLARRALLVGATDASAGTTSIGEARNLSMRTQALLASGLVRISQHAGAVEPGFAALALAETGGAPDVAAEVRIDLAACAQHVGEPLLGGALLRPVLESTQVAPSVRAAALGRLVSCIAHVARRDDIEDALTEADRLLAVDDGISADMRRMERARLAVRSAGYHRWYGDTEDAVTAAREGLNLLTRLSNDLRSECDRLRARLTLELVCGLLDEGELREAETAAHPIVDEPVRATSAASVGRLMLALATRVYLPSGQQDRGRHLLDQAVWMAERHALDGLRADTLTEVSRLEEQAGRAGTALEALRSARAAEQRRMRAMSRAARHVVVEVGANRAVSDTTHQSVAALMRQLAHPVGLPGAVAPPPQVSPPPPKPAQEPSTPPAAENVGTADMDESAQLLDQEGLFRRLRTVRKGERPVALTLVRVEPNQDGTEDRGLDTGIMAGLADKVRDMAPDNAELARSDGGELAVLLPATTRDQAEEFAATIRETAIESDWAGAGGKDMSISTGVVQTDQATTDAAGILTAARDALTPAQTTTSAATSAGSLADHAAAAHRALSEDTPTKPLSNAKPTTEPQQTGRSILSSLSIPTGSGGRRRAGEEQPPGAASRWPAEAPRSTRAERRAQQESSWPAEPTPTPPTGWPAPADEPSQGKRAATPTRPSFSETRTGESTTAIDRTTLPAHGEQPRADNNTSKTNEPASTREDPGLTTRRDIPTLATTGTPSSAPTTDTTPTDTEPAARHRPSQPAHDSGPQPATASGEAAGTSGEPPPSARRSALGLGSVAGSPFGGLSGGDTSAAGEQAGSARRGVSGLGSVAGSAFGGSSEADTSATGEPPPSARRSALGLGSAAGSAFGGLSGGDGGAGGEQPRSARRGVSGLGSVAGSAFGVSSGGDAGVAGEQPRSARQEALRLGPVAGSEFGASSGERTDVSGGPAGSARQSTATPASAAESGRSAAEAAAGGAAAAAAASDAVRTSSGAQRATSASSADAEEAGALGSGVGGVAGSSSGGILRASGDAPAAPRQSSYEETKAELARMMSALNAKSFVVREDESNGARQSIPTPPAPDEVPEPPVRPDVPEPAEPDPIPPPPPEPVPAPEPGRSALMAAFDALTAPMPDLRTESDDGGGGPPVRTPAQSRADVDTADVEESPMDKLFGTGSGQRAKFRSSLGAAFAELGVTEKKVTEPVKEPVQETAYDEPIGPPPRPAGPPRRGEKSSATIASLLTEALAAYQSTAEDSEPHRGQERFDSVVGDDPEPRQPGVQGRHRSPE
ncbi:MAG: diguanylate cyclase [Actinophytocola sp.]|uniref:diguanylate cyclase domain-containing protein n=1 Tax=Actinophytocola sp. TaxID=1872138 RepID=UPI003C7733FF